MPLSTAQLCLLRSLLRTGAPTDLVHIFLNRCGATLQDFESLDKQGLLVLRHNRWSLTDQGRKVYRKEKRGRYF